MSLPSQTDRGLAVAGSWSKTSPSVTRFGDRFGDLDADRLLARDRRQDADLRRRERVREVVLECRDLGHLRPGRELELVAGDARAGDLADDACIHTEVGQSAGQGLRDLAVVALAGGPGRSALEERRLGQDVVRLRGCGRIEQVLLLARLCRLVHRVEERRGLRLADDVGEVRDRVHRRVVVSGPEWDRWCERAVVVHRAPLDTAPGGGVGAADGAVGALDERADRCTRQEQDPGNRERGAGDQGSGAANEGPDHLVQHRADVPARIGKQEEDPERRRGEAPAERVHLNKAAPAEHQQADDHEGRRNEVAGIANERPQAVHDPAPRRASLPLEVDERREEQAGRDEAEADQLGMVVAALLRRTPTPLDARGHARSEGALLAAFRHARLLRRACVVPSTSSGEAQRTRCQVLPG